MSTIETIETGQITINDEELSKFMNLLVSAWSDPEQLFLDFSDLSTPSSKENSRGFSQLYDNLKLVAADANILGAKQVKSADSIYSSKGLNDEAKAFQLLRSIRTSICSNPENSSRQKQCEAMVEALRSISDDYNRSMDEMVKEAFE
ncbi:hypothetical protein GV64_11975 [Endozoicomonas elysicola]|uniref:Uncharacterized protein n=2 Tax=Endozoicomonas elysicola TaxID=305900 RepID=A0A081KB39_9GAMM|nr:hypothetical protein GV64_11975 [Endozoicomonas elysicola]